MIFQWGKDFETGIEIVDAQHRSLLNVASELTNSLLKGYGSGQVKAERVLDELAVYVDEHFATEEKLMMETAYPDMQAHVQEHLAFISRFNDVRARALREAEIPAFEVQGFLYEWIKDHVLNIDQKMAKHIRAHSRS